MKRIPHLLYRWSDLLILTVGIVALVLAPQAGFCLNDMSGGAACSPSGTMVLDLLGFGLILVGATWAFARRWPATGALSRPRNRFLTTWTIVVVTASAWAYLMLLDWHLTPWCEGDVCEGFPDIGPAIQLFMVIGLVVAGIATAIGTRTGQQP